MCVVEEKLLEIEKEAKDGRSKALKEKESKRSYHLIVVVLGFRTDCKFRFFEKNRLWIYRLKNFH